MKAGWEIKTLDEVCVVERGSSPRPIKEFFTTEPDGVNWIKIGDTEEGGKYVFSTRQKITPEGAKQSRYVKEGDFILTNSMSFGRPYIMKTDGYIHDGWFVLRLKDSIDTDYFYHLLSSNLIQEQFTQLAAGAIVKNISGDLVKKAVLPIAPLPEQKRLVTLLDEAFESIATAKANAEQNLKNARALFESHLNEVFTKRGEGWEEKTLGEIYDVRDGTHDSPKYQLTGYPLITSKNLDGHGISFENIKFISEQDYKKINERSAVHKGDVLFAMIGTIGNATSVTIEPDFAIKNVALFKMQNGNHGAFLKYYLDSVTLKMIENAKGTTQKFVGLGYLRGFPISIPNQIEQKIIVAKLDALNEETQRLEALYSRKIAALDELKKALLHRAFSGAL